jgi:hypothetical protein
MHRTGQDRKETSSMCGLERTYCDPDDQNISQLTTVYTHAADDHNWGFWLCVTPDGSSSRFNRTETVTLAPEDCV